MFAVVGEAEIDASRVDEAEAMLKNGMLPQVTAMDGFVSGTWARASDDSRGRSMVIFEDEASAQKALEAAKGMSPPDGAPMKFGTFEVMEVVVQA